MLQICARGFHHLVDGRELIHPGIETVDFARNEVPFFRSHPTSLTPPKFLRLPFAAGAILKS